MSDVPSGRERLTIVYKAADNEPEFELPLRMLFVGDYMGRDERTRDDRIPVRIDKDTFSKVLAAHAPSLDLVVPSAAGSAVRASLTFRRLSDFGPDAVADQIPETKRLLALRDALTTLKQTGDVAAFRKSLGEILPDASARQRLLSTLGLEAP
jgi:type VI secretion system protein ImpB